MQQTLREPERAVPLPVEAGPLPYERVRRVVLYIGILYIVYSYLPRFLAFLYVYPHDYTWQELFLNYRAGFVRRSLLGSLAYVVSPWISPLVFLATLVGLGYCLTIWLSTEFFGKFDPLVILLAFLSPALLIFPTYCVPVFGRKDLFISLLTLVFAKFATRLGREAASAGRIRRLYFWFTVGGGICLLVHELEAFFVPIQLFIMAVLLWSTGRRREIFICSGLASLVLFLLVMSFFLFPVAPNAGELICRSWGDRIPELSCQRLHAYMNPFSWMSISPRQALRLALSTMTSIPTVISYAVALCLALVPIIVTTRLYGQRDFTVVLGKSLFLRLLYPLGILLPFGLFFVGMDYGRWINLLATHALLAACVVIAATRTPQELAARNEEIHQARLTALAERPFFLATGCFFLVAYLTSWHMAHYVRAGGIALRGDFFRWAVVLAATIQKFF